MIADFLALLRADWLFGAICILVVLATCVVLATLCYAGQDVRLTSTHSPDRALWPDGAPDRSPAWTPPDRGVPHPGASFRSERKGIVVNLRRAR